MTLFVIRVGHECRCASPSPEGRSGQRLSSAPAHNRPACIYRRACATQITANKLGKARVQMEGNVAIVQPGTGAIALPTGAAAVAIDLRGLPGVSGLPAPPP